MNKTTFTLGPDAPQARKALSEHLDALDPQKRWKVIVEPYKANRSLAQNRLQHKWMAEAADQLKDETAEEKRGYCKLHFGIPILRSESTEYCEAYDRIIKPLSYEDKILMMMAPLDFPVTSAMTVKQKTNYLEAVQRHFAEQGVLLTQPEDQGRD